MEGVWDGGGVEVSKRFVSLFPSLLKGGAVPQEVINRLYGSTGAVWAYLAVCLTEMVEFFLPSKFLLFGLA